MISKHYVLYHVLPALIVLPVGVILHKFVVLPMAMSDTAPTGWGAIVSPLFLVVVVGMSMIALICTHKRGD